MSAVRSLHELWLELDQLGRLRPRLSASLRACAERLDSLGEPPARELIDELASYRDRMHSLSNRLDGEATSRTDDVADTISFARLERQLEMLLRHEQATAMLDQLLELTHVEIPDFAPLAHCQAEASRLRDIASRPAGIEPDAELDALCQSRHPLNALLKLCDEGDRLPDAEWTEFSDRVTEVYGRQLATALARGRIQRTSGKSGRVLDETRSHSPMHCEGASTTQPSRNTGTLPTAADSLPENDPLVPSPALPVQTRGELAFAENALSDKPTGDELNVDPIVMPSPHASSVFDVRTPPPKLRGIALPEPSIESLPMPEALLASAGPTTTAADDVLTRAEKLPELIVRLVAEDRMSMAWHLSRCLELRKGDLESSPPPWLLSAVVFGRNLSYSKGEIARQLDDELRRFHLELLAEGDQNKQLAIGLMLRAAALPAVLLAGSAPGATILRAFKIEPGFSQLYNYCSRIARYGDRLPGQIAEMFRPQDAGEGEVDLTALAQTATKWLHETAQKVVGYGRTSPLFLHAHWTLTAGTSVRHAESTLLWCKWQETLLLSSRLLRPVCRELEGERNWVKQEIARLSGQVRVEPLDSIARNATPGTGNARGIVLPTAEMHAVLLEAIDIASRWLRLCHAKTSSSASPVSQEVLELRDEVLQRSDGVLNELREQEHANVSPLVQAGIACCRRIVEQIRSLFASDRKLPLHEPDPRHLLNAELLKVPGLELDEQWLPDIDPIALERELIGVLNQGDIGWRQAYEQHARNGNHIATGRLLELDVWSSDVERDEIRLQREAQIADSRLLLDRELNELLLELETVAVEASLSDMEFAAFEQRLVRLQSDLPRVTNFRSYRRHIDQVRLNVQRCRPPVMADGQAPQVQRSPSALEARRQRLARAGTPNTARNEQPFVEAAVYLTDIFSEG